MVARIPKSYSRSRYKLLHKRSTADHRCGIVQFGILLTDTAAIRFESFSRLFLRSLIQNYFRYVDKNLFYFRSIFKNILRWPFVRQFKLRAMLGEQSIIQELKKSNIWEKKKIEKGHSNLLLEPSETNAVKVRSKYGNYLSPFQIVFQLSHFVQGKVIRRIMVSGIRGIKVSH